MIFHVTLVWSPTPAFTQSIPLYIAKTLILMHHWHRLKTLQETLTMNDMYAIVFELNRDSLSDAECFFLLFCFKLKIHCRKNKIWARGLHFAINNTRSRKKALEELVWMGYIRCTVPMSIVRFFWLLMSVRNRVLNLVSLVSKRVWFCTLLMNWVLLLEEATFTF